MAHSDVPWRLGGEASLDEALFASYTSESLGDGRELIRWICPRCHHSHSETLARDDEWTGLDFVHGERVELTIKCDCGLDHLGRPEGEVGCGYRKVIFLGVKE